MKRPMIVALSLAAALGCTDSARVTFGQDPADAGPPQPPLGFDVDDAGREAEVALDPTKDNDGDGWLYAEDCDDRQKNVNPGAVEYPNDGVDNDCDGTIDVVDEACDDTVEVDGYAVTDPYAYARAIGLCKRTTESARDWGLLSAELLRYDGSARVPDTDIQMGILQSFGPNVTPRHGKNMAVLSSGTARTPSEPGYAHQWEGPLPQQHINDSINLKLRIRVPTNALTFTIDYDFYSIEYPDYVGSQFNDEFLAILDTKVPLSDAAKKSIALDSLGNSVSVNNGFFEVCLPSEKNGKVFDCALGTDELVGTGRERAGATSWLRTKAPVMAGEIITIQFVIFDVADRAYDSTVLIDNWLWEASAATDPSTGRPPK